MGRRQQNDTAKKIAIGSAIAAVVGYLTGILTAPKSGKDTRQDVKDTAGKTAADAEKELKKLHTELDKAIAQAKAQKSKFGSKAQQELNGLVDKAKDSKEKVREVLSAVHEGEAEDKDLQRAVKEAGKSVEHLKKYLKK